MKPKTKPATPAPSTPAEPSKRPVGRPKQGTRALTHAERQAAYRARQRDAALIAYGHPQGQPVSAVLTALGRLLAQLDDPEQARDHDTVHSMAERAMGELCARYKLKPKKSR